jgi:hypothetical protein
MISALLLRLGVPRWVAITALCILSACAALWYRSHLIDTGIAMESTRRDAIDVERDRQARAELDDANARVRNAQANLDGAINSIAKLQSELNHEQATSAALQSDLAAGRRRLSVAISGTCRPAQAEQAPSPGAAGVDPGAAATAELDPAAAAGLARLVGEGDAAIVRLNACIAAYAAVVKAVDMDSL